jgi:hypothetical protein
VSAFDLRTPPPLGLRVTASLVALVGLLWFADAAIAGASVAPMGAALRFLPLAPLAVLHAAGIVLHAWGTRLAARVQAASGWFVLLLGMVLVAAGTDAAFVQVDRFGWSGLQRGPGFWLGLFAALQGAVGVLLVWSRRPPSAPYDEP